MIKHNDWSWKMDSKAFCLTLAMLCLLSTTHAFNITRILSIYEGFTTFNDLLTRTGLSKEINSRRTITVLAINNKAANGLVGTPLDVAKRVLSTHVVLDYFDALKLSKLQRKSTIVTTLYQAEGVAGEMQGFLNMTKSGNAVVFGSAMKGAMMESSLVGTVLSQPYNISVLQVSKVMQIPGIDYVAPPEHDAPKAARAPAAVVKPSENPAPAPEEGDEGTSDAPGPAVEISPAGMAPAPDSDSLVADGETAPAPSVEASGSPRFTSSAVATLLVAVVPLLAGI